MQGDAIEDIKSRLSIEDVVSRYVELKRSGRNWRGLSPWTNEKTASFMVSPEKQIWHDFSSGKGGNMFSFVMEMEGIDFKAALELLARQAGVDLSQYQRSGSNQQGKQKEKLHEALELAAKFYQVHLKRNQAALNYVIKKRKFNKQTLLDFKLGYAPENGSLLTKFLLSKGFTLQQLKQTGLSTQRFKEPSDMFRGRIMIPLMDPFGRIIGFTGRLLKDEPNSPKYINTPQTLLYDKSRHVFGLNLAKEAIRKNGYTVVAEGNLDVIASHQVDVKQVVATAGTAMTESQLKIISRLSDSVLLAYDQDEAGLVAAERTIPIASKVGVSLGIITVEGVKDPDELIQKDPKLWQKAIDSPQYALDWLIERYKNKLDIDSAQGKREFTDILLKVVRTLNDSVEQDHYVMVLSKLIDVSPDALRTKLKSTSSTQPKTYLKNTSVKPVDSSLEREQIKAQNRFLSLMLMQPGLRIYLKGFDDTVLPQETAKKLLDFIGENTELSYEEIVAKIPKNDAQMQEFALIVVLLYEEIYQGLELLDLRQEAAQLQARLIAQYVKSRKTNLANIMRQSGETPDLLNQAKQLDQMLNSIKEKING